MAPRPLLGTSHVLGVAVAAIGGLVTVPCADWAAQAFEQIGMVLAVVFAVLAAGVSAWILRTWWALLVVPAFYFLGYLVGAMIDAGIRSPYYLGDASYLELAAGVFAVVELLPLVAGTLFGIAMAKRITQRQKKLATRGEG